MNPKDIKIGSKYLHKDYPGCVWIGAGKRTPFTNEYSDKILVLIQNLETEKVGAIFKAVDDEYGAYQEDWDRFVEIL